MAGIDSIEFDEIEVAGCDEEECSAWEHPEFGRLLLVSNSSPWDYMEQVRHERGDTVEVVWEFCGERRHSAKYFRGRLYHKRGCGSSYMGKAVGCDRIPDDLERELSHIWAASETKESGWHVDDELSADVIGWCSELLAAVGESWSEENFARLLKVLGPAVDEQLFEHLGGTASSSK
eukprot:TRINITY_DN15229_c0_g1_i1.p1 TRINITY_DN15229_c0_g1~~TRINITY_DN15229_c0_g1_i1.p1  ORF type:complete len:177 (+),score=38.91 TRINITY_DN15229_c0_g1_i1:204-734(+)